MHWRLRSLISVIPAALLVMTSCSRGESAEHAATGDASGAAASADRGSGATSSAGKTRFASIPSNPCGWLTAAEVEEVLGQKVIGPPERDGDQCRYPIALDSAILARKTRIREASRKLFGPDAAGAQDPSWNKSAATVKVDVAVDAADASAVDALADTSASSMVRANSEVARAIDSVRRILTQPDVAQGWDMVAGAFSTFDGRIGHVRVAVGESNISDHAISLEKKAAIAARVRDRIPDTPFASPDESASAGASGNRDPCGVLTRSEVEAVLGPLVVDPYRIGQTEPLAESNGRSCGYFTRNHHVLVVTPHWSGGKDTLFVLRGVGKILSAVAPDVGAEAVDTLEGPWDAAVMAMDGSLAFVSGDRLFRISHATSSIDAAKAVQLARTAIGRLATSR